METAIVAVVFFVIGYVGMSLLLAFSRWLNER